MVQNGKTGIVARSENEYISAIEKLYKNKSLRKLLSHNAKEYAVQTFSLDRLVKDWGAFFDKLLTMPKTAKNWLIAKTAKEISAKDVFLESLGDYGKPFIDYCNSRSENEKIRAMKGIIKLNKSTTWRAKTRGTVHHYSSVFPDDELLAFWSKLMRGTHLPKKFRIRQLN